MVSARILGTLAVVLVWSSAHAEERTRFWNLTANTITHFYLAPAGTSNFGADQCPNDKDGTVDHDERLKITGIETGKYDAKFQDSRGRTCIVKNVDVKAGGIFTIEESQVKDCRK
jgi:hypothetical protein